MRKQDLDRSPTGDTFETEPRRGSTKAQAWIRRAGQSTVQRATKKGVRPTPMNLA